MDLSFSGFKLPVTSPLSAKLSLSPSAASAMPVATKEPAAAPDEANKKLRRDKKSTA
jgi:hypothetical protein